ncbi:MAG TPA: hypothetical protein VMY37_07635 [Thermoguttaceae bacterium]|nr:hypothetical protein [Thermoguttaceae bacterium]
MTTEQVPRFDPLWHDILKYHALAVKHCNGIRSTVRLFRRAAYRFAKSLLAIQKHHHNQLLAEAASVGQDIDTWLHGHFEVIEAMGDTQSAIFHSIEEGMTEKEYVRKGQLWIIEKRMKAPAKTARADTKTKCVTDSMTTDQKVEVLTAEVKALRSENHELRRDLATALIESERKDMLIARADRALRKARKPG